MRRFLLEASLELLRARLTVAFLLRRALSRTLSEALVSRSATDPMPPEQLQRDIRYIVALAAHHVPWRSLCLPNALAARRMLARRGYASTLHLGVAHQASGDPHAHAWLEAGGLVITGEDGSQAVTPLPCQTGRGLRKA